MIPLLHFSVSRKIGEHVTLRVSGASTPLCFHVLCVHFFVAFLQKIAFLSFSVLFLLSSRIPQNNINRSETGIGGPKLSETGIGSSKLSVDL